MTEPTTLLQNNNEMTLPPTKIFDFILDIG